MLQFRLQTLLLVFVVLASSLGTFGNWGILAFLFILMIAAVIHVPTTWRNRLLALVVIVGFLGILVCLLLPAPSRRAYESVRRKRCVENLDQIAAALAAYRTEHGRYPPAVVTDASGKAMHSWRVLILPYLGRKDLYEAYDFEQPWNGPTNKKLAERIPDVFRCPTHSPIAAETSYVAVTGPGTAWNENIAADSGAQLRPEQLILLIEVENADIDWMEPRDSTPEDIVPKNGVVSNAGLACPHPSSSRPAGYVVCADGSVRFIGDGIVTSMPNEAISVEAADQVNWEKLGAPVCNLKELYAKGPYRSTMEVLVALPILLLSVGVLLYRAWRSRSTAPPSAENNSEQTTSS